MNREKEILYGNTRNQVLTGEQFEILSINFRRTGKVADEEAFK